MAELRMCPFKAMEVSMDYCKRCPAHKNCALKDGFLDKGKTCEDKDQLLEMCPFKARQVDAEECRDCTLRSGCTYKRD